MVGMSPGRDGREWSLCRPCWSSGIAPIQYTAEVDEEEGQADELPLEHAYARQVVKRGGTR